MRPLLVEDQAVSHRRGQCGRVGVRGGKAPPAVRNVYLMFDHADSSFSHAMFSSVSHCVSRGVDPTPRDHLQYPKLE